MNTARRINIKEAEPFITKDGSQIREILAHRNSVLRKQSLAEARIKPGASTTKHYHRQTEEIYYILEGVGRMELGDRCFDTSPGDGIAILPGTPHRITNMGSTDLVILCCCAPAYENEDTVLL